VKDVYKRTKQGAVGNLELNPTPAESPTRGYGRCIYVTCMYVSSFNDTKRCCL